MTTTSSGVDIPNQVPRELVAGDTWVWNRQLASFPSSLWRLTYYFRGVGSLDVLAASAPDGIGFTVSVPAVGANSTGSLSPGIYRWTAKVSNEATGEVYSAGEDDVQIRANFATAFPGDLRPHAEIMLRAVEAELEARMGMSARSTVGGPASQATAPGSAHTEIEIAQRRLVKEPLEKLRQLRAGYLNELALLRNGGILPDVVAVFRRPGGRRDGDGAWS